MRKLLLVNGIKQGLILKQDRGNLYKSVFLKVTEYS